MTNIIIVGEKNYTNFSNLIIDFFKDFKEDEGQERLLQRVLPYCGTTKHS